MGGLLAGIADIRRNTAPLCLALLRGAGLCFLARRAPGGEHRATWSVGSVERTHRGSSLQKDASPSGCRAVFLF